MTKPKSRITKVEATVVQKMNKAVWQERAVFVPALNFLITFCFKTKSNIRSIMASFFLKSIYPELALY